MNLEVKWWFFVDSDKQIFGYWKKWGSKIKYSAKQDELLQVNNAKVKGKTNIHAFFVWTNKREFILTTKSKETRDEFVKAIALLIDPDHDKQPEDSKHQESQDGEAKSEQREESKLSVEVDHRDSSW